ncbi:Hint domain-containing protein [Yoonia tamlensis]|uniref:Hint domain-containing protein n=1 Tax=Yoonia tamlensis TaxID=390270 RepID=A0A1I6FXR4_9RHOB|nr:Hint domain-containing protein [Yoonia tamlensis]SFR34742.1 Hint domain-containing protein [Yoonia tamlensis]
MKTSNLTGASAITKTPRAGSDVQARQSQNKYPTRKYEIAYLNAENEIVEFARMAPALPTFENAFGALGRGAMVHTQNGPMTVEDLLPGDRIRLANGECETLLWRGSMVLHPDAVEPNSEHCCLTRITAEALGPSRPTPDLVLGPTAHLLHRAAGVRTLTGKRAAYIPARDFVDGSHFIALSPAIPVQLYQLGFARQESLMVNGIEIESLHPGTFFGLGLRGDLLAQYLALFPHKRDLDDFGEMRYPRLRMRDLELLE